MDPMTRPISPSTHPEMFNIVKLGDHGPGNKFKTPPPSPRRKEQHPPRIVKAPRQVPLLHETNAEAGVARELFATPPQ
jgi:hypothetical protein